MRAVSVQPFWARRTTIRSLRPWFFLVLGLLVIDQLTKIATIDLLSLGSGIEVTPFFNFVHVRNPGAAFSFLADASGWQRWFFSGLAVVVSAWLGFMIWQSPDDKLFCVAASLMMSGALGNLIDRVVHGEVIDFLDFHWAGWHWPAFNVADSAITVGAVLFVWVEILRYRKAKANSLDHEHPPQP
ncbi:MAG TPA: signal peptidase II [Burkholderiales bacterium]|jgi:signal peptidase II|nr:signal peptidase II [Burkholderiales bacterium]